MLFYGYIRANMNMISAPEQVVGWPPVLTSMSSAWGQLVVSEQKSWRGNVWLELAFESQLQWSVPWSISGCLCSPISLFIVQLSFITLCRLHSSFCADERVYPSHTHSANLEIVVQADVQRSVISAPQVNNMVCIWKGGVCLSLLSQKCTFFQL